ncbi:MAG: misacylated tRNA(Ala) deacylase [Actinomycetota bacterium]|jgi:misacylated tRNA(Ala) deacylase|nr:misacylated tRNA(Ala) deacylase [Actinomycetota bacterium]
MTDMLFARDAYLRTCDATVIATTDEGAVLDRTVSYPRGGGQPGDSGSLSWDGGSCAVTDTFRSKETGELIHVLDTPPPPVGTAVTVNVDWDRRHLLMRTHTALHALSGIIFTDYDAKVTGGNMEPGTARMDFELASMSQEFDREIEAKLNQALSRDVEVHVRFIPRDQALADPSLARLKVDLVPRDVDPIRVIEIVGIDTQMDGGTHVARTGEVGQVRVVKTESKGKGNKRMRIELDPD